MAAKLSSLENLFVDSYDQTGRLIVNVAERLII